MVFIDFLYVRKDSIMLSEQTILFFSDWAETFFLDVENLQIFWHMFYREKYEYRMTI